jgi:hypothetical protein
MDPVQAPGRLRSQLIKVRTPASHDCHDDTTSLPAPLHSGATAGAAYRLLAVLEPVTAPLEDLARTGYEANWLCYVASHTTEHASELDRHTIERLLALPATCDSTSVATVSTKKTAILNRCRSVRLEH